MSFSLVLVCFLQTNNKKHKTNKIRAITQLQTAWRIPITTKINETAIFEYLVYEIQIWSDQTRNTAWVAFTLDGARQYIPQIHFTDGNKPCCKCISWVMTYIFYQFIDVLQLWNERNSIQIYSSHLLRTFSKNNLHNVVL